MYNTTVNHKDKLEMRNSLLFQTAWEAYELEIKLIIIIKIEVELVFTLK